ncbi:MAG: VWA domain-containing protein [Planctomycetia bacterium]|nr:VWA domain-containing protein [Planctomycetia bacterium]
MRRSLLLFAVLLLAARPAAAKLEPAEWTAAEQTFKQLFAHPGEAEGKVAALEAVAKDGETRAWRLLAEGTIQEAGHQAKTGEQLSKSIVELSALLGKKSSEMYPADRENMYRLQGEVSDLEVARAASEAVLGKLVLTFASATEEARRQLLSLTRGHKDWTVRAMGARVAATFPDETAAKAVLAEALGASQDPRVKSIALDALQKATGSGWQDLVVARIEDPDWGVQVLAARIAGERQIGKAIPVLIKALVKASPRVTEEVGKALRTLTGQSIEAYPEPWAKWWEANRSKWGEDGRPLQPVSGAPKQSDIDFYGLKVKSDKVLFVIDISGSMKAEKKAPTPTEPPRRGATTGDDPKAPEPPPQKFSGPKIEIAKQELRRAVKALPKAATFNIIAFNHGVQQWQPKMLEATEANKEQAYAWIRDMAPAGSTYIDGALRLGFKMAGMGAYDKAYPGVAVDTIILLSDGAPTDNAFPESKDMDPKEILAHVREWNPQKRIVIHCVGIDNVVQGIEFMKKLAAENGGTYVDG